MKLEIGKQYVHIRNLKNYRLMFLSKIKLGDSTWRSVVVYECLYDNPDGQIWTRFKDDFINNFVEYSDY